MDQGPRQYRPSLERLEARDLPSASHFIGASLSDGGAQRPASDLRVWTGPTQRQSLAGPSGAPSGHGASSPTPAWVDQSLLQTLARALYAPVTTTAPFKVGTEVFPPGTYAVPQPTPAEVQRESFWAEFVGKYYVGPPRFSNQAATIHIYSNGPSVTSNQFLKGRAQVLLSPPADPTAAPSTNDPAAGRVTGLVAIFPLNVLQGSSQFYLDATNLPGVASNDPNALDHGMPSRLQLLLDVGTTSGIYATVTYATTPPTVTNPSTGQAEPLVGGSGGAVAYTQGVGVLDIKYSPPQHRGPGAIQTGTVLVRIQGVTNLSGVQNALYKGIN
jgi:hypothetical protein